MGIAFLLLLLLVGATMVLAVLEVAGSLQNHKRRTFCLVVGVAGMRPLPARPVLGVFTILQLIQPEAERAFSEADLPYVKMEDFRNQEGTTAEE